uniref:4Fe-4S ferredoxin-type domain-containing protein n=1 Tax=Chromera velia CCMP2878 TaxID=1169474 RepID=A0A0G4FDH0_9ALVE|eukprot:Cvel_16313.t1-p1 / transcript=Cvel_16313.t1 / gene=Cvel_16313 / organism=Chromera_velia_CCMP2878 / gene_product=hypothetical protein / transcript_product=hypothetical protein / location=Cvel_scaffold1252:2120-3421(-) / protein_length=434 / sequence_SO=supercontig / SO=protein_coding / is_pseudo=false
MEKKEPCDIEDLLVQSAAMPSRGPESLEEVVSSGLCSSCGACEAVLGSEAVSMQFQEPHSRLRPCFHRRLTPEEQKKVLKICPGAFVGGQEGMAGMVHTNDPVVGGYVSMHCGHAADPGVRHKAAAGGGLTALALHLLESGEVQCIVHANPSVYYRDLTSSGSRVSRTKEELLGGMGSRYARTAVLQGISDVICSGELFALIGKPCDINAMVNGLGSVWKGANCRYLLSISCGMYPDGTTPDKFLQMHKIESEDVETFQWRGNGCPGDCPGVVTKSGKSFAMDYVDFWTVPPRNHSILHTWQWRCKLCPDYLGMQADVVVMDCWPRSEPEHRDSMTPSRAGERDGWVYIVARTPQGSGLVQRAEEAGTLVLYEDRTPGFEDIRFRQPHQVRRALTQWSRRLAHSESSHPVPPRVFRWGERQSRLPKQHCGGRIC